MKAIDEYLPFWQNNQPQGALACTHCEQIKSTRRNTYFPIFFKGNKETVPHMSLAIPIFEQNLENRKKTFPDPLKTIHVR